MISYIQYICIFILFILCVSLLIYNLYNAEGFENNTTEIIPLIADTNNIPNYNDKSNTMDDADTPSTAASSALPSTTASSAMPSTTASSALPSTTASSALPSTAASSALPSTTASSALPSTAASSALPSTTMQSALPSTTMQSALPSTTMQSAAMPSTTASSAISSSSLHPSTTSFNNNDAYIPYNEVYIQSSSAWEHQTLDQCYDKCSSDDKCIGFNRKIGAAPSDTMAVCHPIYDLKQCNTNRKGDRQQRVEAIKYTAYIKAKNEYGAIIPALCALSNYTYYIRSVLYPSKYLGVNENEVQLGEMMDQMWEIENGLDGAVFLKHAVSNSVICNIDGIVGLRDYDEVINTLDKQMASINVFDSPSNSSVVFKSYVAHDLYLAVNPDNSKYLVFSKLDSTDGHKFKLISVASKDKFSNVGGNAGSDEQTAETIDVEKIKTLLYGLPQQQNGLNGVANKVSNGDNFKIYMADKYPMVNHNEIVDESALTTYDSLTKTNDELEYQLNRNNGKINDKYNDIYRKLSNMHLNDRINDVRYLEKIINS